MNAIVAGTCLDADAATAYAAGKLTDEELSVVDDHVDACAECRRLLSRAAEMLTPSPVETPPADDSPAADRLAPGARVGRYVVGSLVGAGGMGVVYAARDPELRRDVALKVVRAGILSADRAAEDLLRREAMAMARIAHPNVVGVHDLFVHDGAMFIAMELIDGATLRGWLGAARRSWRDAVGVMTLAGRGLAAAHAEGVVHRDFKPENVLVGEGGRVCVSDFGLSRLVATPKAQAQSNHESAAPEASTLVAGGTPRYMAPEQRTGTATALADQFSFCVVLYEALYGEHPFARGARDVKPAAAASTVPGWVRRCVLRGLRERPEDRYDTMHALLADLADDPRTRRVSAGVAMAAVALLGAGVATWAHARHVRAATCTGSATKLAGVWDDARKKTAASAFDAVGTPFARDQWRFVDRALDRYTRRWTEARTGACEAVLAHGEPADVAIDPRVQCLDDRLEETRAVVDGIAAVTDDDQAGKAVTAAGSIQSLESCARARAGYADARHRDPERLARTAAIRSDLARAAALSYFDRHDDAAALAERAADSAEHLGDDALLAQALERAANSRASSGGASWQKGKAEFYRAIDVADRAGDDATRAGAWAGLTFLVGAFESSPVDVRRAFEQGMSAVARMGGDDELEASLHANYASALASQGDCEHARAEFDRAIALSGAVGSELENGARFLGLAEADIECRDLTAAGAHLARAEAKLAPIVSATDTYLRNVRNDQAVVRTESLDFAGARDVARPLVDGYASGSAAGGAYAATAMATLSEAYLGLERYDEARALAAASLAIGDRLKLPTGFLIAPLTDLGRALVGLKQPEAAIPPLERAVAVEGADPEYRADARFALARAFALLRRDPKRATALATEARALLDALSKPTPLQAAKRAEIDAWLTSPRALP